MLTRKSPDVRRKHISASLNPFGAQAGRSSTTSLCARLRSKSDFRWIGVRFALTYSFVSRGRYVPLSSQTGLAVTVITLNSTGCRVTSFWSSSTSGLISDFIRHCSPTWHRGGHWDQYILNYRLINDMILSGDAHSSVVSFVSHIRWVLRNMRVDNSV